MPSNGPEVRRTDLDQVLNDHRRALLVRLNRQLAHARDESWTQIERWVDDAETRMGGDLLLSAPSSERRQDFTDVAYRSLRFRT